MDGNGLVHVEVLDDGRVRFSCFLTGDMIPEDGVIRRGAISSADLRKLADLADKVKV